VRSAPAPAPAPTRLREVAAPRACGTRRRARCGGCGAARAGLRAARAGVCGPAWAARAACACAREGRAGPRGRTRAARDAGAAGSARVRLRRCRRAAVCVGQLRGARGGVRRRVWPCWTRTRAPEVVLATQVRTRLWSGAACCLPG